jgi:putative endonuclease
VGFRILRRNWSPGRGRNEIDIIAEQRGTIVFVEVKTRSPRSLRSPGSAVDEEKRRRIRRAAASFLARYREPAPHRFDVVSVFLDSQDQIREVALDSGAFE